MYFLSKTICLQWFVTAQVEQHFRANIKNLFRSPQKYSFLKSLDIFPSFQTNVKPAQRNFFSAAITFVRNVISSHFSTAPQLC